MQTLWASAGKIINQQIEMTICYDQKVALFSYHLRTPHIVKNVKSTALQEVIIALNVIDVYCR